MSVARNLGLDDPDNNVLALARDRWSSWRLEHEALDVVEDLVDLPTWMRNAEPENADRVLLALAELASPEGGDDLVATGALAWLLLPGASLLAARLATLTSSIDEVLAAQLWVEARTFPWQRGRRVAANILMNARKAVMRDLGVGVAADPAWSRSILIAPTEDVWGVLDGPATDTQPEHELAELLEWACSQGVITEDDRALLVDVAATADRHQPRRAGRGHAGLLSNDVSTEVAHRHGVSPITIRRRTRRCVQALRDARKLSA